MFLITTKGIPELKSNSSRSDALLDFLNKCLQSDPALRPTTKQLLEVREVNTTRNQLTVLFY